MKHCEYLTDEYIERVRNEDIGEFKLLSVSKTKNFNNRPIKVYLIEARCMTAVYFAMAANYVKTFSRHVTYEAFSNYFVTEYSPEEFEKLYKEYHAIYENVIDTLCNRLGIKKPNYDYECYLAQADNYSATIYIFTVTGNY